jgi:hypothetical protein
MIAQTLGRHRFAGLKQQQSEQATHLAAEDVDLLSPVDDTHRAEEHELHSPTLTTGKPSCK